MTIYDLVRNLREAVAWLDPKSGDIKVEKEYWGQTIWIYWIVGRFYKSNFLGRRQLIREFRKIKRELEEHGRGEYDGVKNKDVVLEYGKHRVETFSVGHRNKPHKAFEIRLGIRATEDLEVPTDFKDFQSSVKAFDVITFPEPLSA